MTVNQADAFTRLCEAVPEPLHNKLRIHWDGWLQSCSSENISSDPGVDLKLFGKVFACSDFVALVCNRKPSLWFDLINSGDLEKCKSLDDYQSELEKLLAELPANNDIALMQCLRQFRNREMLRIAWRDLLEQASTVDTLQNLTDLAEACVDQTLAFLHEDQSAALGVPCNVQGEEQKLIVLGMGKLGGYELNYSSDIDLIFAFSEEGETRGGRTMANSQFFIRLGQRFIKVINDVTADGFVFRVDMRLRPYGDSGPLVMSFAGMENYYQTQGRDWERYAMIKARVIGGDRVAGEQLMQMLHPFVYRRYLDFGAFEAIREMKAMIDAEIRRKGHKQNIKLGRGGIREIEFIGQTYQLIRGGGEPELQIRSILKVLPLLAEKGYLQEEATNELVESYDFLRRLENRLQMHADKQTHNLPEDEIIQQSIALAMNADNWGDVCTAVEFHRQRVHAHFNEVFAAPQFAGDDKNEASNSLASLWRSQLDENEALEILQENAIDDAAECYRLLSSFRDSSLIKSLSGQAQQRLDTLMPVLLSEMAGVANSAELAKRVLNLLQAVVRRSVYLALLIEYPAALKLLIRLCSESSWIASLLTRYPILLDELLDPQALYALADHQQLSDELTIMLSHVEEEDLEQQMDVLRKFKQAQVLRIAAMDVAEAIDVFDVSGQLSMIAEVLLDKVYQLAWQHMTRRHGVPRCQIDGEDYQPGMAIVGYGKMGGHELGYGSDLDLVFLHDSKGQNQFTDGDKSLDNNTFFARLAQRIVHILGAQTSTGRLYEVDMRLRPDGAAGMLVSSLEAFERYQQDKAWTWEHQALIRARIVYGTTHLVEEFDRIRRSVLTQARDSNRLQAEVIEMRQKMRDSLGSKQPDSFHLKQDKGGLVDIEFIAQYAVLLSAAEHENIVEHRSTRQLLIALQNNNCLNEQQATGLIEIFALYRARSHQRALQEQSSVLSNDEFVEQRNQVQQIWQQLLGETPGEQV